MDKRSPLVRAKMTPRQLLTACDGFYEAPKDGQKHKGPMVGYAARDAHGKQLVGFHYANFAKIEEWPTICYEFVARPLAEKILAKFRDDFYSGPVAICGAPLGGLGLGRDLATCLQCRYIYPEKVVTVLKTPTSKEVSELVFGRHAPEVGEKVILVEDVCNNFSTTSKLIKLVEDRGALVKAIVCFLNRSPFVGGEYTHENRGYKVIALWREPMPEFEQTDGQAASFITSGNVVLDPKKGWDRLMTAMQP